MTVVTTATLARNLAPAASAPRVAVAVPLVRPAVAEPPQDAVAGVGEQPPVVEEPPRRGRRPTALGAPGGVPGGVQANPEREHEAQVGRLFLDARSKGLTVEALVARAREIVALAERLGL